MRLLPTGLALAALAFSAPAFAQHELALTVGGFNGPNRTTKSNANLSFSSTVGIQADYSCYVRSYKYADLYGEVHLLVSPKQDVSSTLTSATADFTSLYITPGVRLKFYPKKRLSPWVVGGGGYALYRQSDKTIAGAANPASGYTNSGAIEFGGGMDFVYSPRMSFRLEARDFYTASPNFNTPIYGRGQFNFVVGAGVVFRLGAK